MLFLVPPLFAIVLWFTAWSVGSLRRPLATGAIVLTGIGLQFFGRGDSQDLTMLGLVMSCIMAIYFSILMKAG